MLYTIKAGGGTFRTGGSTDTGNELGARASHTVATQAEMVVSTIGATIMSWTVGGVDLIDGYLDETELRTFAGHRSAILVPWSNRIRNGVWDDAGVLRKVVDAGNHDPESLHGLVYDAEFTVAQLSDSRIELVYQLEASAGYPYALAVSVTYELSASGLTMRLSVKNLADKPAPIGLGWHPYFFRAEEDLPNRLRATSQNMENRAVDQRAGEWNLGASYYVLTDDDVIPLDEPFAEFYGFADGIPDECDASLVDVNRNIDFPVRGGRLKMCADFATTPLGIGTWHVFAGQNLERGALESVAVEPCTAMADALNRLREHMLVEPGQAQEMTVNLEYVPEN
ncbi:MAG: hypothetical protein GX483_00540 [Actinomycetaceae bacterium]|nr:hypothetical protein [Actinomycetaceae bacterium]